MHLNWCHVSKRGKMKNYRLLTMFHRCAKGITVEGSFIERSKKQRQRNIAFCAFIFNNSRKCARCKKKSWSLSSKFQTQIPKKISNLLLQSLSFPSLAFLIAMALNIVTASS